MAWPHRQSCSRLKGLSIDILRYPSKLPPLYDTFGKGVVVIFSAVVRMAAFLYVILCPSMAACAITEPFGRPAVTTAALSLHRGRPVRG